LGEDEDTYSKIAGGHDDHVVLDKSFIKMKEKTKFEPCDLLSTDGSFMHVKCKTCPSTMSHVMTQALSSTRVLRGESQARKAFDDFLTCKAPNHQKLTDLRNHCSSFGGAITGGIDLVILARWRVAPEIKQLPLLTRIALDSWLRGMPCEEGIVLVGT
jgi:uncharacterized protein (TIGR04141 family)